MNGITNIGNGKNGNSGGGTLLYPSNQFNIASTQDLTNNYSNYGIGINGLLSPQSIVVNDYTYAFGTTTYYIYDNKTNLLVSGFNYPIHYQQYYKNSYTNYKSGSFYSNGKIYIPTYDYADHLGSYYNFISIITLNDNSFTAINGQISSNSIGLIFTYDGFLYLVTRSSNNNYSTIYKCDYSGNNSVALDSLQNMTGFISDKTTFNKAYAIEYKGEVHLFLGKGEYNSDHYIFYESYLKYLGTLKYMNLDLSVLKACVYKEYLFLLAYSIYGSNHNYGIYVYDGTNNNVTLFLMITDFIEMSYDSYTDIFITGNKLHIAFGSSNLNRIIEFQESVLYNLHKNYFIYTNGALINDNNITIIDGGAKVIVDGNVTILTTDDFYCTIVDENNNLIEIKYQLTDNGIKGYFLKGWKVNNNEITTTGLQEVTVSFPIMIESN